MRLEALPKFSFWEVLFLESETRGAAQIFILGSLFLESEARGGAQIFIFVGVVCLGPILRIMAAPPWKSWKYIQKT